MTLEEKSGISEVIWTRSLHENISRQSNWLQSKPFAIPRDATTMAKTLHEPCMSECVSVYLLRVAQSEWLHFPACFSAPWLQGSDLSPRWSSTQRQPPPWARYRTGRRSPRTAGGLRRRRMLRRCSYSAHPTQRTQRTHPQQPCCR